MYFYWSKAYFKTKHLMLFFIHAKYLNSSLHMLQEGHLRAWAWGHSQTSGECTSTRTSPSVWFEVLGILGISAHMRRSYASASAMAKALTERKDLLRFFFFPFLPVIPTGYYWWKNEKMWSILENRMPTRTEENNRRKKYARVKTITLK